MEDDVIAEHAGIDPGTTTRASVRLKKGTAALALANVTGRNALGQFMRWPLDGCTTRPDATRTAEGYRIGKCHSF